ncbi:MAG: glutaredoxin domain-containing protein [Polyangia bacterium]
MVVYVGERCPWCNRVKSYLRKRRVRFIEVDVSKDPAAARSLMARTGQTGVPQIDIEGRYVVGFDRAKIDELLDLTPEQSAA